MNQEAITITLWVAGGVGGVLFAILGFIAAHLFNKTIKLGERVTAHDVEIIQLRVALAKAETDLKYQHDKTEGAVSAAIAKLEIALTNIGHNIEQKVTTLHGRLDTFLIESARQQGQAAHPLHPQHGGNGNT